MADAKKAPPEFINAPLEDATFSEETLKQVEELVEQEEGATHRFAGPWGWTITVVAVAMTLFHLYAAYATVPQQLLREVHVAFALASCSCCSR